MKIIKKRSPRRNRGVAFKVVGSGVVEARIPQWLDDRAFDEIVANMSSRLQALLARYESQQVRPWPRDHTILIGGNLVSCIQTIGSSVRLTEHGLEIGGKLQRDEALRRWLMARAGKIIPERLGVWSERMNLYPSSWRLSNARYLWGSCTTRGRVSFNWRLAMAPQEVVDYLVIHELAHLRYPNHQQQFWSLVASYAPDYRRIEAWLKEEGHALLASFH
ncbi:MAG: M48 family metallopeptidase [Campylobacterales bacterium]